MEKLAAVSVLVNVLCLVLSCVILAVPDWIVNGHYSYGLLQVCMHDHCMSYSQYSHFYGNESTTIATVTAVIVTLTLNVMTFTLSAVFICNHKYKYKPRLICTTMALSLSAGIISGLVFLLWLVVGLAMGGEVEHYGAVFWLTPFLSIFNFIHTSTCAGLKRFSNRKEAVFVPLQDIKKSVSNIDHQPAGSSNTAKYSPLTDHLHTDHQDLEGLT